MCGSRRNSRWANSALVVNVDERDWACLDNVAGMLPSTALQTEVERCAPSPHVVQSKLANVSSFSGDVLCRLFLRSALLCKGLCLIRAVVNAVLSLYAAILNPLFCLKTSGVGLQRGCSTRRRTGRPHCACATTVRLSR